MTIDTKVAQKYFNNYELLKFELVELLTSKAQLLEEDAIISVDFYEYRLLVEFTKTDSKHLKILNISLTY